MPAPSRSRHAVVAIEGGIAIAQRLVIVVPPLCFEVCGLRQKTRVRGVQRPTGLRVVSRPAVGEVVSSSQWRAVELIYGDAEEQHPRREEEAPRRRRGVKNEEKE